MLLNEHLISIATFDFLGEFDVIDTILYFPELKLGTSRSLMTRLEETGYESNYFIQNAGDMLLFIPIGISLLLTFLVLSCVGVRKNKMKVHAKKVKDMLFWNATLRVLIELYLELLLSASINIYIFDRNDGETYPAVRYSNIMAFTVMAILIALPFFIFVKYSTNVDRWEDE